MKIIQGWILKYTLKKTTHHTKDQTGWLVMLNFIEYKF